MTARGDHPPTTLQLALIGRGEAIASILRWKARQALLTEQLRIVEQQLEFDRRRLEFADNTVAAARKCVMKVPAPGIKSQSLQRRS